MRDGGFLARALHLAGYRLLKAQPLDAHSSF